MKRRVRLGMVIAAGLIAAAYLVWRYLVPPHGITEASLERIRAGMTKQEVEAVIGVPPGDYPPGGTAYMTIWSSTEDFPAGWTRETWRSTDGAIAVYFDRDQKVLTTSGGFITSESPWLAPLRRRLGL